MSAPEFRYFHPTPDTTVEELHGQYQRLARELHPDRGGPPGAFEQMREEFERAVLHVAARARRTAQRERAAALLAMAAEGLARNPGAVGAILRGIGDGRAAAWLRERAPDFLIDMGRSLVQRLLEREEGRGEGREE